VIDDVLPPWQPRMIEVGGTATVIPSGGKAFGPQFEDTIVHSPEYQEIAQDRWAAADTVLLLVRGVE
jgi:hypothetical protein